VASEVWQGKQKKKAYPLFFKLLTIQEADIVAWEEDWDMNYKNGLNCYLIPWDVSLYLSTAKWYETC
jgi:hypothetical protein